MIFAAAAAVIIIAMMNHHCLRIHYVFVISPTVLVEISSPLLFIISDYRYFSSNQLDTTRCTFAINQLNIQYSG